MPMIGKVREVDAARVFAVDSMTLTQGGYTQATSILLQMPGSETLLCLTDGQAQCEHADAVYERFGEFRQRTGRGALPALSEGRKGRRRREAELHDDDDDE